jgi:hypothetical protein
MGYPAERELGRRPSDSGWKRIYFEQGCDCIHKFKTMKVCPSEMSDEEAVKYYEQHCDCDRNYV